MIHLYDDDPRMLSDPLYFSKMGSFPQIVHGLNKALKKLSKYSELEEADWVGASNSLNYDFGFANKKRFHIGAWECSELPLQLINWRQGLESENFKFFGMSPQISTLWNKYNFPTKTVNIGVDLDFWTKDSVRKFDKFTILSLAACNFRSGINNIISSFIEVAKNIDCKLIIKDTIKSNNKLSYIVSDLQSKGYDIEYICEFQTIEEIKTLMLKSHVLVYTPLMGSAGLPILQAAALEVPCIIGDYCPGNIYPHSEAVKCSEVSISQIKSFLSENFGLSYSFPQGFVNESTAKVFWVNDLDLCNKIIDIKENYDKYIHKCSESRLSVEMNWTWDNSARDLESFLLEKN